MLDFQLQQAPMRFGLAEGVDPHQVPFGTLTTAENACWDRSGCLRKRYGTANLTTSIVGGGSISAAARLVTRNGELALIDGSRIYSYTTSGWVDHGRVPEIGLDWSTAIDLIGGVATSDSTVLSNGQSVEVWVTGNPARYSLGDLYYQIRDIATGTIVTGPAKLASNVNPIIRVVSTGTTWVVLFADGGGILLWASSGVLGGTLKADAATSVWLDAIVLGTDFVVGYKLAAGGIRLVRYTLTTPPVQQATSTVTGEASVSINSISLAGGVGESLYIAYAVQGTGIKVALANPSTMVQTVAPAAIESSASTNLGTVAATRESSTTCLIVYGLTTSTVCAGVTRTVSVNNSGSVTTGRSTYFMRPMSRPVLIGSRFYCVLTNDFLGLASAAAAAFTSSNVTNSDTFLADVTREDTSSEPFRQVGKIDVLTGGRWTSGYVSSTPTVSSGVVGIMVGYQSTPSTDTIRFRQGVRAVRLLTGSALPADMWRPVPFGPETYLSAGMLSAYDGVEVLGYGWPHGPYLEPIHTAATASGGAMSGSYIYNVTAERRSSAGVLHRAPTGIAITISVSGLNDSVTVNIIQASLGHSPRNYGLYPIYRSLAGQPIAQRIAVEPSFMCFADTGLTFPVSTTDVSGDTNIDPTTLGTDGFSLATRPALYTSGGELEDTQMPSSLTVAQHQSRLWSLLGDGRTVAISKDATLNPYVAPGFHPNVALTFDLPLTALQALDDKMIAFARDALFYVVGNGPVPNGSGGSYEIGRVQTDVGCINPRSVASVPMGLLFQSARGIYLLSRKLEVSWIGRPVKDELAAYPNITSAVVVAARNEIRWTANNAAGSAGIVIVYNYAEDQWTTSKYTVGGVYGAPIADACIWSSKWTFVTTSGQVCTEDATTYLDGGSTWVPLTLETAWISAAGPLAYQAVRNFALEGVANSNHDLTLSVAFDNETSYVQTKTFAAGSSVTSIGPLESCEISIGTRRKCQSIRFKIQDATPTNPGSYPVGTGQGPSFDMLGIEVGVKRGFVPKAAAKTG